MPVGHGGGVWLLQFGPDAVVEGSRAAVLGHVTALASVERGALGRGRLFTVVARSAKVVGGVESNTPASAAAVGTAAGIDAGRETCVSTTAAHGCDVVSVDRYRQVANHDHLIGDSAAGRTVDRGMVAAIRDHRHNHQVVAALAGEEQRPVGFIAVSLKAESLGYIAPKVKDAPVMKPAIRPLIKAMDDKNDATRTYAARALEHIGTPEAKAAVKQRR